MSKSPEEYFQRHDFATQSKEARLSEGEQVFLEKYVGVKPEDVLDKLGLDAPMEPRAVALSQAVDAATGHAVEPAEVEETSADLALVRDFEGALRKLPDLQLVSFFLGSQEFTIPIQAVQEVIRYVEPTKLPESPPYLAGMVNLRGTITACIKLATLMGMGEAETSDHATPRSRFIIVCRRQGLQVGLLVEQVATMYRVSQDQIEWNIEQRMGGMVEIVTALMRRGEELLGIISIDKIVEKVLKQ
ncbi:chemotaxis protein CheW [Megalodesulfovibrio gigas]|uniref:CheW n=2 Tax=Megalodesulfovibrio gigas TaxID=879 RepID=T2G7U0_MEGG1|nr:chemotaxis protein CheW [Megalodesulfovibrio gigas]AAX37305.1 CheW [Megalodesulfovibrio gigas]AGW11962.1 CheW [Megalodesulfovibrio gigas DSM 1382 = ATCC 19364]